MADETYRQCELRQECGRVHVAWIPNRFARAGRRLRIDGLGDGWIVTKVYGSATREHLDIERSVQRDVAEVLSGE